jgi:glutaconate CoA-transferase subunit A
MRMNARHMKTKKAEILSLEEAVKKYMHDGAMMCTGGFTAMNRSPVAWVWETIRQGFKGIHNIDPHGCLTSWLLNAADRMSIHETAWTGWGEMAGKLDVQSGNRYKKGELLLEEYSHGAMALRFLAGAVGSPFMPYFAPPGSDLYNPDYDALGKGPSICCRQSGRSLPLFMFPRPVKKERPDGEASARWTRKWPLPATG